MHTSTRTTTTTTYSTPPGRTLGETRTPTLYGMNRVKDSLYEHREVTCGLYGKSTIVEDYNGRMEKKADFYDGGMSRVWCCNPQYLPRAPLSSIDDEPDDLGHPSPPPVVTRTHVYHTTPPPVVTRTHVYHTTPAPVVTPTHVYHTAPPPVVHYTAPTQTHVHHLHSQPVVHHTAPTRTHVHHVHSQPPQPPTITFNITPLLSMLFGGGRKDDD
jgi:hypothetical protein